MSSLKLTIKNKLTAYVMVATLISILSIASISAYYSVSPVYVTKTISREIILSIINVTVKLYDPTKVISNYTGPYLSIYKTDNPYSEAENVIRLMNKKLTDSKACIASYNNKIITKSKYYFAYQPKNDIKLAKLREDYNVDKIVGSGNNDFEQLVSLANWVNSRWEHGSSGTFDSTYFDASTVLSQAKNGATFWCHVSAMTLVQMAATIGYEGRLVSLSRSGYISEHAVAEFWSNYYQKWVLIDPDFNVWYSENGIPLNVLEIHKHMMAGSTDKITIVRGKHRPISELESRIPTLYNYYTYFETDMRNDWLTNHYFPGHPARSDEATLYWNDRKLPPLFNFKTDVNNSAELYWDLNRTYISFEHVSTSNLEVAANLQTITPNFSYFEVIIDGTSVIKVKTNKIIWKFHYGKNSFYVRSINSFGQKGIPSEVTVTIRANGYGSETRH